MKSFVTLTAVLFWYLTASPLGALTLKDARGEAVTMAKPPERIASLTVGTDEVLFALLAGDERRRIVTLSTLATDAHYSAIAAEAAGLAKPLGAELESLAALKPDLVILARFTKPETVKLLENLKVPAFVLGNFTSLTDIENNIVTVGKLVGKVAQAKDLVSGMRAKISAGKRPEKKAVILNYSDGGNLYGAGTTFDDIVRAAHCENLAGALGFTGWPKVSLEKIATLKPDFILAQGEPDEREKLLRKMQAQPGWREIPAVKKGKLIVVPARYLLSLSHHVAEAVVRVRQGAYGS